jgi:hypothetical protein
LIIQRQAVIPLANQLNTAVRLYTNPGEQQFDAHTIQIDSLSIRVKLRC